MKKYDLKMEVVRTSFEEVKTVTFFLSKLVGIINSIGT